MAHETSTGAARTSRPTHIGEWLNIMVGFSDTLRHLRVYTPPDYERDKRRYPVLYLFHGSGDNDATWTTFGHAHWILDNLIATGKAKPMIVVMTDGHAY